MNLLRITRLGIFIILFFMSLTSVSFSQDNRSGIKIPEFKRSTQVFEENLNTCETALADLDSDGDLDAVFATMGTARIKTPSRVMLNDGKGGFSGSGQEFPAEIHGVATGDLDGDGDQDIFFAPSRQNKPNPVFFNNGKGVFERSKTRFSLEPTENIRLIDLENDGDLDAYSERGSIIYINDGKGNFKKSSSTFPAAGSFSDMNNDGFVDIVSSEKGRGFYVYLNNKRGNFSEYSFLSNSDIILCSIACSDIDNDGDEDVIYTNGIGQVTKPGGVFLNDGKGSLSDTGQRLSFPAGGWIGTCDINNDGFMDVVTAYKNNPAEIWMNNGKGIFIDSGIKLGEGTGERSICLTEDIDNDGDMDIFITNRLTGKHELWFNQLITDNR
ncbi:FG-GAP repeat domain-containing protein [candidate division KSB1 bacterium]